jgi:hypothetical protein
MNEERQWQLPFPVLELSGCPAASELGGHDPMEVGLG